MGVTEIIIKVNETCVINLWIIYIYKTIYLLTI